MGDQKSGHPQRHRPTGPHRLEEIDEPVRRAGDEEAGRLCRHVGGGPVGQRELHRHPAYPGHVVALFRVTRSVGETDQRRSGGAVQMFCARKLRRLALAVNLPRYRVPFACNARQPGCAPPLARIASIASSGVTERAMGEYYVTAVIASVSLPLNWFGRGM